MAHQSRYPSCEEAELLYPRLLDNSHANTREEAFASLRSIEQTWVKKLDTATRFSIS